MTDLADRLSAYLEKTDFEQRIHRFMKQALPKLTFTEVDEEQDMDSYKVFTEFTQMIEQTLQDFMQEAKMQEKDFVAEFEGMMKRGEATHMQRMLTLSDYNAFMDMAMDFTCSPEDDDSD